VPQPARALVVIGLLAACAGTDRRTGFATRPEQADAERRCGAGSLPACGTLGKMLTANPDASKDFERGMVLLEIACGQDDLPACTHLAGVYVRESHGKTSLARAHDLAAHACTLRSGPACTQLGEVIFHEKGDQRARAEAFQKGCDLGDAEGCELYAAAQGGKEADVALAHACELGRLSSCHTLAGKRVREPETRREAAELMLRSCQRGHAQSCESVAIWMAPLISANTDCARVVPLADKACAAKRRTACAVIDACKLAIPSEAEAALKRLRAACNDDDPLACLYWADAESARTQPPPDLERVVRAYEGVCGTEGDPLSAVACPRLLAIKLARAQTASEAEAPLSELRRFCDQSAGEACCELGEQYRIGKWVPADAGKARELRGQACRLGCDRCCR
jgi:TPR repeat protein